MIVSGKSQIAPPGFESYFGRIVVIKIGGELMADPKVARELANDIVLLKSLDINPVVIHGGGPQIDALLDKLGIASEFHNGLRLSDQRTVEVAEMVLSGTINKRLVGWISEAGGRAIGISGKDGGFVTADKMDSPSQVEESSRNFISPSFIGKPVKVDVTIINGLIDCGMIPIVSPICMGYDGQTYNVNADTIAGAVAAALGAAQLLLLTNVCGVMDADGLQFDKLDPFQIQDLKKKGIIYGGMIPKLDACINAVSSGCSAAVVLDGNVLRTILTALTSVGSVGTIIKADYMENSFSTQLVSCD